MNEQLWLQFRACRSDSTRNHLVEHYRDQAERQARDLWAKMVPAMQNAVPVDEAIGEAFLALVEALDEFDHQREIPFEPYLAQRIRWKIENACRASRRQRAMAGSFDDLPDALDDDPARPGSRHGSDGDPAARAWQRDLAAVILKRFDAVTARILELHYWGGLNFAQIAKRMGVSARRCREMHQEALASLRSAMNEDDVLGRQRLATFLLGKPLPAGLADEPANP